MNANQSDDACSGRQEGGLPSNAGVNRAVAKLKVYKWERLAYTDAANIAIPVRQPVVSRLVGQLKSFLRYIVS